MGTSGSSDDCTPEIDELYDRFTREISRAWSARGHLEEDGDIAAQVRGPLERCLNVYNQHCAQDHKVDLVALQMARAYIPAETKGPHSPIIQIKVGQLAELFPDEPDKYKRGYTFFIWDFDFRLHVRIFSRVEDYEEVLTSYRRENWDSRPRESGHTFITHVTAITGADGPSALIAATPQPWWRGNSDETSRPNQGCPSLEVAARVVLESTENSRKLLLGQFGQQQHERNLIYLTVYVAGEPIGGAAIYSFRPVHDKYVIILDILVRHLLYRVRSGDDLAAAVINARNNAKWETIRNYVHRIAHDVRKPAQRAKRIVDRLLERRSGELSGALVEILEQLASQLDTLTRLAATTVGESIEDLRSEARADAQLDGSIPKKWWLLVGFDRIGLDPSVPQQP